MTNYDAPFSIGEYWIQCAVDYWTAMSFPAIYLAKHI